MGDIFKKRSRPGRFRLMVQVLFLLAFACLFIFYALWLDSIEERVEDGPARPTAIEAVTPHLGYIELAHAVRVGAVDVHTPALAFLILLLLLSIAIKKGFCSHVCPVGTLSEGLWWLGRKITKGRDLRLPAFIDLPLRLAKYALLVFFLVKIAGLTAETLHLLAYSPAVKLSDLRMWYFITDGPDWLYYALGGLVLVSVFVPRFFCRYLCPYGALLGVFSMLSPVKIHRDSSRCALGCKDCDRVCPAWIKLEKVEVVVSDECHLCLRCLDVCPVPGALEVRLGKNKRLPGWVVPAVVVGAILLGIGAMYLNDGLRSDITRDEYLARIGEIHYPLYSLDLGAPLTPDSPTPYDRRMLTPLRAYEAKPRKVLELLPTESLELGAAAASLGLEEGAAEP